MSITNKQEAETLLNEPLSFSVDNPAKYEPVLAGNYLMNKFNKSI